MFFKRRGDLPQQILNARQPPPVQTVAASAELPKSTIFVDGPYMQNAYRHEFDQDAHLGMNVGGEVVVELQPEPTDTYDPLAVALRVDGKRVGYLARPRQFLPLIQRAHAKARSHPGTTDTQGRVQSSTEQGLRSGPFSVICGSRCKTHARPALMGKTPRGKYEGDPFVVATVNGETIGVLPTGSDPFDEGLVELIEAGSQGARVRVNFNENFGTYVARLFLN